MIDRRFVGFAACAVALAGCSNEAGDGSGSESKGTAIQLPTEPLQMANVKERPCVFEPVGLGRHIFPEEERSPRVDVKPRDSNCFYTVQTLVKSKDETVKIAQITLNMEGYPTDDYEGMTKTFQQTPADGFEIPTNHSVLHKPGEQYSYSAYPKQGSLTVTVKSRELGEEADALARALTKNLSSRLN